MKCKHDYYPAFTDKINGRAIIIMVCKNCGGEKVIEKYVGEQTAQQHSH